MICIDGDFMKKLGFLLGCFLFLSSSAFAVLAPYYQTIREIQKVLDDQRLYSLLGSSEVIQSIVHTDEGYTIFTKNFMVPVTIKYIPEAKIGPVRFEIIFQQPVALLK